MRERRYNWVLFLLFSVVFFFLQAFYSYHFFYIEQFQLFIYTSNFLHQFLAYPGGLVEYIGLFATQFFILPFAGPAIIALLITLLFFISALLFKKQEPEEKTNVQLLLFPGSIAMASLFLCLDFNFYIQGILAFFICLLFLLISVSIRNFLLKIVVAFMAVLLLFWVAGSVSVLFAAAFFILEFHRNKSFKKTMPRILLLLWAIFIFYAGVRYGYLGEFRMSFLPDMYYQPRVEPPVFIYIPWLLLLGFVLFIPFLRNIKSYGKNAACLASIVIFSALVIYGFFNLHERKIYAFQKLDYFARNEQWDEIIREQTDSEYSNYLLLSYLNLAHSQKGELLQNLFSAEQHGVEGLKVQPENIRLVAPMLSDINFCIGDYASSQQYAFEGNLACRGAGSPRLLKRLAETAFVFGKNELARKYLMQLAKSWYYADWAKKQMAKLYAPSENETNDMAAMRRCLPEKNSREFASDFPDQLEQLCRINPENHTASNYLQAWYLLSKNIEGLSFFLDSKSGQNSERKELPKVCQQALLAYYETKPGQWTDLGITAGTIDLYNSYKLFLKKHRNDNQLIDLMKKQFGNTYWFYLQFN